MRNRTVLTALMTGCALLISGGYALAVPTVGDRGCTASDPAPRVQIAQISALVNPAPQPRSSRAPDDCLAFIAGKSTSTAVLTRCLRQSAPRTAISPAVFSQIAAKLQPADLPRLRGACRDGDLRQGVRRDIN